MSPSVAETELALREAGERGADLMALRANLSLSPAERIAELVAMNRLHAELQARTVPAEIRAALERRERELAARRLAEA